MVGKQFQTISFEVFFLTKGGYSFRRINFNRELIPDYWCSYREGSFANIELSFGNNILFGNG